MREFTVASTNKYVFIEIMLTFFLSNTGEA
jgi:hypothetical protein